MHDDLPAVEVRVPERGSDVQDRAGGERPELVERDPALQVGEREGEERGVGRDDRERRVPVHRAAGAEGEHDEALPGEPVEGLGLHGREVGAVDVAVARLVGGQVVGDPHAVGVAAAQVVLGVVDREPVGAADDVRLLHGLAVDVVDDVEPRAAVGSEGERVELVARRGDDHVGRVEDVAHGGREAERPQGVRGRDVDCHGSSRPCASAGRIARS
ncbi:hypothetical protein CTKZ_12310 [Cellulomonas algicola]|uniref:Uncharacterized protein n=1 Tax=Cellulomonas algicola TaxID=2071633 RepID=A0A401UY98_9CELL|nr:hypothetical protein CTKZ_12310 [Cellulomonas algicola]